MYNVIYGGIGMKILVCDDNKEICNNIAEYIKNNFSHSIFVAYDKDSIYQYFYKSEFDLLIIDIVLGNINGIDIAKEFTKQFPNLKVIFITGYGDTYYKEIYNDLEPCGFLEKPIQYNILNFFIKKIENDYNSNNDKLQITYNYNSYVIPYNDIIYIQSDKRLSIIFTENHEYKTYKKLSDMYEELPDNFIRCHQSFYVNIREITGMRTDSFILKDVVVPISRTYMKDSQKAYRKYLESLEIK